MRKHTDRPRALPLATMAAIRLRHRSVSDAETWKLRVSFDTLVAVNTWDLADNFDDLNERYGHL